MKFKGCSAGLILCFLCFNAALYAERVEIPEGTRVAMRLKADLLSSQVHEGSPVYFEVARPVMVRGAVVIPAGAVGWGAVQSVKEDKVIKFDIEGVRLPDLTIVTLRSIREKTKKSSKDQLKVESDLGDTVGAPKGTEFEAYVDGAITVEAAGAAPTPAPEEVAPAAKPTLAVTPAPKTTAPAQPTPAPAVQTTTPVPQPTTPAQPAPAPQPAALPAAAPGEPVTLQCFSDPSGADIVIDEDFRGTTPSILRIASGKHHLEFQLSGYTMFARDLDLKSGMGVQTIRTTLQKKE